LPDYHSLIWLPIFLISAAVSLWCFRTSVPLIFCVDDPPPAGKLKTYLPLNGRWLRGGVGAAVLFAGILLALVAGMVALFGSMTLISWALGNR